MNRASTDHSTHPGQPAASRKGFVGPVMLITVGLTVLANNLIPEFHFGNWWPVVLIAIGSGWLLDRAADRTHRKER